MTDVIAPAGNEEEGALKQRQLDAAEVERIINAKSSHEWAVKEVREDIRKLVSLAQCVCMCVGGRGGGGHVTRSGVSVAPRQTVTLLFSDWTHVCNWGVMHWPHDTNRMSGRGNSSTLTTWRRRRLWRRS